MSLGTALQNGHSPSQILNYLKNNFPKLAGPISKAFAAGYSTEKVLSYLSQFMNKKDTKGLSPNEIDSLRSQQYSKNAIRTASAFLPAAISSFPGALQGSTSANVGPTPMSNAPISNRPQIPPSQPISGEPSEVPISSQTQPEQNIQAPIPSSSPVDSINIIKQMGIEPQIKSLQQAGNTPEAIAAAVGVSLRPNQKKWLDDQIKSGKAKPLADMIQDVISQPTKNMQAQPAQSQPQEPIQKPEEIEEPKIEKGHLVSTPNGKVGEVKSFRNGKALIEENGKLHQVEEDDLISSPLPEKDMADLYDDLIGGIEKETGEQVSRSVNVAAYNPATNRLLFQPHGGGFYIYGNIPEEDKNLLTKFLVNRKTTGESFIGGWEEGTKSPIGAAMSLLIRRLQTERGGKGNEYEEKFESIYEALKPAIEALKKRKRDEKRRKR